MTKLKFIGTPEIAACSLLQWLILRIYILAKISYRSLQGEENATQCNARQD